MTRKVFGEYFSKFFMHRCLYESNYFSDDEVVIEKINERMCELEKRVKGASRISEI